MVPLGARAAAWLERYLEEVRPMLLAGRDEGVCFLTDFGEAFEKNRLGDLVRCYVEGAGLKVIGSCHLFRDAMATHMLDNGADIRYIQAILWQWTDGYTGKPNGRVLQPYKGCNGLNRTRIRSHSCRNPFGPAKGPHVPFRGTTGW